MANVGDVKKVKGENGNYMVKTLENGYSIAQGMLAARQATMSNLMFAAR